MFLESVKKVNENNYNVKIVKSGSHVSIKKYSELQTRVKSACGYKKYDVTEIGDIYEVESGEFISQEKFEGMYVAQEITKQEYFFTKEKSKYHSLNYLERRLRNKLISLRRSKERIINLVNANVHNQVQRVKFLTLTFKENITDVKEANTLFKNFVKRYNYYLKKNGYESLKYIAILENQERGSIHYHIILFNAPYIEFNKYMELWGYGSVYIEALIKGNKKVEIDGSTGEFKIDGETIDNIGAYITKTIDYVTKTFKELENNLEELENLSFDKLNVIFTENSKVYQTSRNLNQAQEVYLEVSSAFKRLISYLEVFYLDNLYQNEFENELFEVVNYIFNYKDDLEYLTEFLNKVLEN